MKTSFKKLTSVFLAVVMLFSVCAIGASAADTGKAPTGGASFKFTDNQNWGSVYVYAWNDSGDVTAAWPGDPGNAPEINGYGETVFTIDVPDGATGCVINNGQGAQTTDITDFSVEGYYTDGSTNEKGHYVAIPWPGSGGGEDPGNPGGGGGGGYGGSSFKFTDNQNWGSIYVYAWNDGGDVTAKWPGDPGGSPEQNGYGETVFTINVPDGATGCVINNGQGAQTTDITDFSVEGYYTDGSTDDKGHYVAIPWPGSGGGNDPWDPGPNPGDGSYVLCIWTKVEGTEDGKNSEAMFNSDGSITYDFDNESYVFVRNNSTGVQYCTDGWTDFATEVTLVNEHSLSDPANFNKMYVPAGQHTLYLSDNGNDTFTLSLDSGDIPIDPQPSSEDPQPSSSEPTEPPTPSSEPTQPTSADITQPSSASESTEPPTPSTSSQPDTTPTPAPTSDPVKDKLVVKTTLNKAYPKETDITDKKVTVAYNLVAPQLISDGQGTVTYDNTKLKLVSMELPKITDMLTKNNAATASTAQFNFTYIDPKTKLGAFDFTKGGELVVLTFEVIGDAKGTASVDLTIEELDAVGTVYFEAGTPNLPDANYVISSLGTPSVTNGEPSSQPTTQPSTPTPTGSDTTPTGSDTTPTSSETVPTGSETTPTGSETTEPSTPAPTQPSTPAPTQPTNPKPTNPKPTTPKPAKDLGPGANGANAEQTILKSKNDKDPKGSAFNLLQVKNTKTTKNSIKITYKKPSKTKKFVIYGNMCGKSYKKLKTTTGKSFTYKKLKKGKYYKFLVMALDKKGKVVSTSKTIHVATKGGKVGNTKKITITNAKSTKTIKKGKTFKLKTKLTAESKKLKVKEHRKVAFESSKTSIAKVSKKGKITAKKKGTCYIYAYAQNGVMAKIKISVK